LEFVYLNRGNPLTYVLFSVLNVQTKLASPSSHCPPLVQRLCPRGTQDSDRGILMSPRVVFVVPRSSLLSLSLSPLEVLCSIPETVSGTWGAIFPSHSKYCFADSERRCRYRHNSLWRHLSGKAGGCLSYSSRRPLWGVEGAGPEYRTSRFSQLSSVF